MATLAAIAAKLPASKVSPVSRAYKIRAAAGGELSAFEHDSPQPPPEGMPTLVLAHGWALTRESWDLVIAELLTRRNVRVVTYDQRGHGKSKMGHVKPSIRQLGDDLQAVLAHTCKTGSVVLGGHSMGGMTVMGYAGLHHADFKKRVRGVMLAATAASIEGRTPIPLEGLVMRVASLAPRIGPRQLVPKWAQGPLLFGEGADPEHVSIAVRQIQHTPMPTIGRYFDALNQHDELYALAHFVDVPTHVIVGTRDRLTPVSDARAIKDQMPHADLTVLEGKGHMLTYEATSTLVDAIVSLLDGVHPPQ